MSSHRDRILDYLRAHPDGADDDVLAKELGISPRQQVNSICRQLAAQGVLIRQPDPITGKLVNRLVGGPVAVSNVSASSQRPPTITHFLVGPVLTLVGEAEVMQFRYNGEQRIDEDEVKLAIKEALEADGWKVEVKWSKAHGIDIDASRGQERLVIEAKGEGKLRAQRANGFDNALGELLRAHAPNASYGLALPAHRQFVGLILRRQGTVSAHLNLCFFLVRRAPSGGYEVGLISPSAHSDSL